MRSQAVRRAVSRRRSLLFEYASFNCRRRLIKPTDLAVLAFVDASRSILHWRQQDSTKLKQDLVLVTNQAPNATTTKPLGDLNQRLKARYFI